MGEHIKFDFINIAVNTQLYIVPLSIQMLIENAVKHNIISSSRPLNIEIKIEGKFLVVKNNLQIKSFKTESTKVGLDNINKRYKLMANQNITVNETKDTFIVKLPLIKMNELK